MSIVLIPPVFQTIRTGAVTAALQVVVHLDNFININSVF